MHLQGADAAQTVVVSGERRSAAPSSPIRLLAGWSLWLFLGLVALDAAFIELHRLHLQGIVGAQFELTSEHTIPEYYEHLKELLLVVFTGALVARRRESVYACWAALFTYLLLDDTFEFHERIGAFVAERLPARELPGIEAQVVGELVPSAIVVTLLIVAVGMLWRSSSALARRFSIGASLALISLGAFGVLIDMIHSLVTQDPWNYRLGIIEEGGEMLVLTALVMYVAISLPASVIRADDAERDIVATARG